MRILVDIDGVLAETVTAALAMLNPRYGLSLMKADITEWNPDIGDTNFALALAGLMQDWGFVETIGVVDGAHEALAELTAAGHEIVAVTDRPQSTLVETALWLDELGLFAPVLFTQGIGKENIRGDLLIDDAVHNVLRFAKTGRPAILFDQPWNVGEPVEGLVTRARGWAEVVAQLR